MIRRMIGVWVLGVAVLMSGASHGALIDVTVATDKPQYLPGEPLFIDVVGYNNSDADVRLTFGSSVTATYTVDSTYTYPQVGLAVMTYLTIPAKGSFSRQFRYSWYYLLEPGVHTVVGNVGRYGESSPVSFEVVEPVLPTESFFINFEDPPSGTAPPTGIERYWAQGVHFRSAGTDSVFMENVNGNKYLRTRPVWYPSSYDDIAADFDMPIFGAAAEVSSDPGNTVTMVAKDAGGRVLGTVTSPPIQAYGQFHGPLTITSDIPIASLEWWPSDDHAGVLIDNLYVVVPEPGMALMLGVGLLALRRRRCGGSA